MSKEEKIKKNQGYLLSPPTSSVLALVVITPEDLSYFKAGSGNLVLLEKIQEWGVDTFFVFTPENKKFPSDISHLKFTSLMEAKGLYDIDTSESPSSSIIPWFFRALTYVLTTSHPSGHSYTGLTILNVSNLRTEPIDEPGEALENDYKEAVEALLRVNRLDVTLPIMEIDRNPLKERMRNAKATRRPFFSFLRPYYEEPRYQEGMYRTHYTPTLLPFYRPVWIEKFLKTVEEKEGFQWFNTFSLWDESADVIACGVKLFGMGWLDRDPRNIDLQKQTEISTTPNV